MAKENQPARESAPAKNYRVAHTQVGSWPQGFVLSADDLPGAAPTETDPEKHREAREANLKRLLDLGALVPADEPRTGAPPIGPDTVGRKDVDVHTDTAAAAAKLAAAGKGPVAATQPSVAATQPPGQTNKGPVLP